jgi:hypothetical protein
MKTEIIEEIKSLNDRDFSDYRFLVTNIKDKISQFDEANKNQIKQDKDMDAYAFRAKSTDYIKGVYNKKLGEFRSNFFWNEELIRQEVLSNPDILEEVYRKSYLYIDPFYSQTIERMGTGPTELDKAMTSSSHFNRNYKSGYYLKPRPNNASKKKSEGCFVATFAYNSYEHNDVLLLRRFRDKTLLTSNRGENFVNFYYKYSPKLVVLLNSIRFPKSIIKFFLKITIIGYLKRKKNEE